MAQIYYKNSQTNILTPLSYQDFNAASIWHTHTWQDIYKEEYQTDATGKIIPGNEIPQSLPITKGGAHIQSSNTQTTNGVYALKSGDTTIQKIPAKNGVFGYFNGANNYPDFDIWPIVAGGTGATSAEEVAQKFRICITNIPGTTQIIPLSYIYSYDAFITSSKTNVWASIHLPYQFLPNTVGVFQYYPKIVNQPGTTTSATAYGTENYVYGFSANFTTNETVTSTECIYKYGWTAPSGSVSGTTGKIGSALGDVTLHTYGAEIKNTNNQLIYQDGSIITLNMSFTTTPNNSFTNNTPVFLFNGFAVSDTYVPPLVSQIILPPKELVG